MKQIDLGKLNNVEFKSQQDSRSSNELKSNESLNKQITTKKVELKTNNHTKLNKFLIILIIILIVIGVIIFIFLKNSFGSIQGTYSTVKKVFNECSGDSCQTVPLDTPTCTGIFCNERQLPQTDGKTNILILGVDAIGDKNGNNQGNADWMLTDVMMIASYNHKTGYLTMISIPRDTEATYMNYYGNTETTKINAVYSNTGWGYGQKDHAKGVKAISEQITKITDLPIHYSALITFTGFKEIIDSIGGVNINVENDITDYYPAVQLSAEYKKKNCKIVFVEDGNYCQWSLKAGTYDMNGEQALVYARSRKHSTDWDRARRQQIVIDAVRQKVLSSNTLLNPTKLTDIINSVQSNLKVSSYDANDIVAALQLKEKYKGMMSVVLDPNFLPGTILSVNGSSDYKITNLKAIKDKLNSIQENPAIYKENANIFEYYNSPEPDNLTEKLNLTINKIPTTLTIEKLFNWTKVVDINDMMISNYSSSSSDSRKPYFYDYTNGSKPESKNLLINNGLVEIKLNNNEIFKNINDEDFAIIWK